MPQSPFTAVKNRVIFLVCWLVWSSMQFKMLYYDWKIEWQYALTDIIISNGLLAVTCLLISMNLRYYRPEKGRYLHLAVLSIAISGLWSAIVRFGLGAIFNDNAEYLSFLYQSMPVRFDFAFLITGYAAILSTLWYTQQEQKENERRKSDAEKLAKEAELFKLRQQLQPHFLFNSLNSISALAGNQPDQARKMIQQLSDFLRGTLKKEEHQLIELREELQYLELYLDIEKVRFGHRLTTDIQCNEGSSELKIPSMLLQPLVENAIKFGLYDTTDAVTIGIHTKLEGNYLVVTVQNPFDPETSRPRQGTGFGLNSVQRRLYLLYARNDLLSTSAENNNFISTLKIPQHDKSADH